jgi:transposase-like protein
MGLGRRLQGFISTGAAAEMAGFDVTVIFKAIRDHEIQAYRIGVGNKTKRLCVDPDDVRDFIERKLSDNRESSAEAARRYGIAPSTLRRILKCSGKSAPPKGKFWRLDPAEVDRLMENYWKTLSKNTAAYWGRVENAVRAAAMKDRHTKAVASRAGSIVSLDTKPSLNSSERSSHSSVAEFTLGQAA